MAKALGEVSGLLRRFVASASAACAPRRELGRQSAALIRAVTMLQSQIGLDHGFPAFAGFCLLRRRDEPVANLLKALLHRLDHEVVAAPEMPVETAMRLARSAHNVVTAGPFRPLAT